VATLNQFRKQRVYTYYPWTSPLSIIIISIISKRFCTSRLAKRVRSQCGNYEFILDYIFRLSRNLKNGRVCSEWCTQVLFLSFYQWSYVNSLSLSLSPSLSLSLSLSLSWLHNRETMKGMDTELVEKTIWEVAALVQSMEKSLIRKNKTTRYRLFSVKND
jgi:hypothetical protein